MKLTDQNEQDVLSVENTKDQVLACISNCEVDTSHSIEGDDGAFGRWNTANAYIVDSLHKMGAIPNENNILPQKSQLIVCRYEEDSQFLGGIFFANKMNKKNLLDALPGTAREMTMDRQYFGVIAWKDGSIYLCRSYGNGMIDPNFVLIEEINKKQLKFVNTLVNAWQE